MKLQTNKIFSKCHTYRLRKCRSMSRNVNSTVRRISRDEGTLDLDLLERRLKQVLEN